MKCLSEQSVLHGFRMGENYLLAQSVIHCVLWVPTRRLFQDAKYLSRNPGLT